MLNFQKFEIKYRRISL